MSTNIIHYHSDSRTAERWSIERKYERLRKLCAELDADAAPDTAPCELSYQASEGDPA